MEGFRRLPQGRTQVVHLLIVAAGSGRRMGAAANKLLLPLLGRPVLAWTLEAALASEAIRWIGIVGQPVDAEAVAAIVTDAEADRPVHWILGGDTRQESVRRGLAALPTDAAGVLIHDGARCLVEPSLFGRCAEAIRGGEAVIAATPVTDTIKQIDESGRIHSTPDRQWLWAAQTPQGFPVRTLVEAHARAEAEGWNVTDDASLFERLGLPVRVLEAPPSNIKLTTPIDLTLAEAVLRSRRPLSDL
jgi:2-C-methyl-D-erythritol 4-phosphate cytidylyltransferase